MSEKTAYNAFRRGVRQAGDRIDRIENLVGTGFPDTNCCLEGREFWMEIKAPKEPKRASTPLFGSNHKLSQEQMNWFLAQHRAGGIGYVYIETDKLRLLVDGCKWGDQINTMTVGQLRAVCIWCAPRARTTGFDWRLLREALTK